MTGRFLFLFLTLTDDRSTGHVLFTIGVDAYPADYDLSVRFPGRFFYLLAPPRRGDRPIAYTVCSSLGPALKRNIYDSLKNGVLDSSCPLHVLLP